MSRGGAIFGPPIAKRLMSYFAAPPPSAPANAFPELTKREREILGLLAAQQTNQEIARRLQVRLKTVQNHVSNIFSKLQVAGRAQAMVRARDAGLGERKPEPRSYQGSTGVLRLIVEPPLFP